MAAIAANKTTSFRYPTKIVPMFRHCLVPIPDRTTHKPKAKNLSVVNKPAFLNSNVDKHIFSFLPVSDVLKCERVAKAFHQSINSTNLWEELCYRELNISRNAGLDAFDFLPESCGRSFRKGTLAATPAVFDAKIWRRLLKEEIEDTSPIPEHLSLARAKENDPCDPSLRFGREWVWVNPPENYTISIDENSHLFLEKIPDLKPDEAPTLKKKTLSTFWPKKQEKRKLAIANTIANKGVLFNNPKVGNPTLITASNLEVESQLMRKKNPSGWFCIRIKPFGEGKSYPELEEAAKAAGVAIASLAQVVDVKSLKRATKKKHPQEASSKKPLSQVRTSTKVVLPTGVTTHALCVEGSEGLILQWFPDNIRDPSTGAAVSLPDK